MFYVVTEDGIKCGITINDINKKTGVTLKKEDFKRIGNDKLINLTDDDFDFIKDRKQLSRIIMSRLFKKESGQWLLYVILVIQFILLLK